MKPLQLDQAGFEAGFEGREIGGGHGGMVWLAGASVNVIGRVCNSCVIVHGCSRKVQDTNARDETR